MLNFVRTALLTGTLIGTIAVAPTALRADDHHDDHHHDDHHHDDHARVYHDRGHNDDHHWDAHEDRAYRIWARENHRPYEDFNRLRDEDRQAYWAWRHEHSDAVLHIDIR